MAFPDVNKEGTLGEGERESLSRSRHPGLANSPEQTEGGGHDGSDNRNSSGLPQRRTARLNADGGITGSAHKSV